jgi:hypothetical protein
MAVLACLLLHASSASSAATAAATAGAAAGAAPGAPEPTPPPAFSLDLDYDYVYTPAGPAIAIVNPGRYFNRPLYGDGNGLLEVLVTFSV